MYGATIMDEKTCVSRERGVGLIPMKRVKNEGTNRAVFFFFGRHPALSLCACGFIERKGRHDQVFITKQSRHVMKFS